MPPKKKTKVPSRAVPTDADSPLPEPVTFDGWTDEQETTLFKAISVYRLKPAGMHKHFRIIGISELMKNHGVSDSHTNIDGIWRKLQSLYNLEGLDEREDLLEDDGSPDPGTDFALPPDDFGTLMTERRIDPHSPDSPTRASTFTFPIAATAPRGKKGRTIRSVSADGSRTARTNSILADDTEDELSMKSASPAPRKTKIVSTRGRKPGPMTKSTRGRGGLKSKLTGTSPRRKPPPTPVTTTKPAPAPPSAKDDPSEDEADSASTTSSSSSASSSSSGSPEPVKPAKGKRVAKERGEDQSDDEELSDVPDELDDDDVGTVVETEAGTDAADDASEMGESTTAAESPALTVPSRGKGPGRGRGGRGRGGKRGGKRGGDVRRSTRRK